jgi:hypothetical protein
MEYEADHTELITCRKGCVRKLLVGRIKKHDEICHEVFQKKRREFHAKDQWIANKEQRKLMKHALVAQKK